MEAPTWEYVPMPDGSSSDAPVMRPGPRRRRCPRPRIRRARLWIAPRSSAIGAQDATRAPERRESSSKWPRDRTEGLARPHTTWFATVEGPDPGVGYLQRA